MAPMFEVVESVHCFGFTFCGTWCCGDCAECGNDPNTPIKEEWNLCEIGLLGVGCSWGIPQFLLDRWGGCFNRSCDQDKREDNPGPCINRVCLKAGKNKHSKFLGDKCCGGDRCWGNECPSEPEDE